MQDKAFLHKAAAGGMAEIQLGQLAEQKGNSPEVKQFGQKMVEDHSRLNDQMKPLAEQLGDLPRAKRCYEQVTAYDGNPLLPEAYEALQRLGR